MASQRDVKNRISSVQNTGVPVRSARAMESDGRAEISVLSSNTRIASNTPSPTVSPWSLTAMAGDCGIISGIARDAASTDATPRAHELGHVHGTHHAHGTRMESDPSPSRRR